MRTKVRLGGISELGIYGASLRDEIVAGGTGSEAAIAATLQAQVDRGLYVSRHMRGDALDLRTRGLSTAEVGRLEDAVRGLGANTLLEQTPPHLHVEDIPSWYAGLDPLVVLVTTLGASYLL
jgi:hypothetical protein